MYRIQFRVWELGEIKNINLNNASIEEVELLLRKFNNKNRVKFIVSEYENNTEFKYIQFTEYGE